jgi:NADPH:quinone reductase-like Zn-dependent oxidoreductase
MAMKAWKCEGFGIDNLSLAERPRPEPGARDVLIRIHATTVSAGDWRLCTRCLPPGFGAVAPLAFGMRKPRKPYLGTECAGVVEAVGAAVKRFHPGDRVFAYPGSRLGGHAEYIALPEDAAIAAIPEGMEFGTAAALPFGGTTALYFLVHRGELRQGEKLLVIGASGCVGSYAVQIGRHLGAEVTAVCSGRNAELVAGLGAARVIDYAREDFRRNGVRYDLILDLVGGMTRKGCAGSLSDGGRLLLPVAGLGQMIAAGFSGGRVIAGEAKDNAADLRTLADLTTSGAITPLIGHRYGFEAVPEAYRTVASRRKRGAVVIDLP